MPNYYPGGLGNVYSRLSLTTYTITELKDIYVSSQVSIEDEDEQDFLALRLIEYFGVSGKGLRVRYGL